MPSFKYRARLPDGRIQAGMIETDTMNAAQLALEDRGMEVLLIEPTKNVQVVSRGLFNSIFNRVTPRDLVVVSRTLSVMVSASVPLTNALSDISRQMKNPRMKAVLVDVAREVEGGARLSDALERHADIFSGFYINMVRSGESSGHLDQVLEYLADQQEKDYDLTAKIRGAMIYPAFILGAMVVVGFVMMSFVVPKLVAVLTEANVDLPLSTRILITVSDFFASYWWLIILLSIVAGIAIRVFIKTPAGKFTRDALLLRLPVFGKLFQSVYVVQFSRSLATLVKGGVDTVTALDVVSGVMGNEVWRRLVKETIREVNDGNSITTALERSRYVPAMMIQMLAVGESTGRTSDILIRLSSFFSREVDNVVANLVALIEPIVLIVLGIGVGALVSAILLPLYQLSSGVAG
jgi:type IV pilus assembly protein PilC